ncbi:MAG: tetratricopeptide repeat protein [Candidatus Promineofilum sp.]|nr:tetratricopeptide repeat protein [Promineifilum sp.]
MPDRHQLEQAIAVQESLRGTLDDAILDATLDALRRQLAALEPEAAPRRVQATLLFLDLAGHTGLIQGLDPEEIVEVIDRALARLAKPVKRHGGRIVRYQGDGFKAAFGLPTAQENDPDRAVRAALEIVSEAGRIAAELEAERGLPGFQVRLGIDTGLVLIGEGAEGEDSVTGLPVNLAARLEGLAELGTVLISHHTYQHVRGVFDMQPLPPIAVRGFAQPVAVYRVLRPKARSFRTRRRGVEGVETRMVGRDAEMHALQTHFHAVITGGQARSVVVVGEAGLGKSRLLYEFENWGDLQPVNVQLYRGRARLETQHLPFGLLRDVFVFRCGIYDDDAPPTVSDKLVTGFRSLLGDDMAEMAAHRVGHLLGYNFSASPHVQPLLADAKQVRAVALQHVTAYFRVATDRAPLVLLLEDLHWADDSSLEAIELLVTSLRDRPLLVLGAARPSLYERRPEWMANRPTHHRLDLSLLADDASSQLVAEILQKAGVVPDRLRDLIVERAEGNPFYVEELIKMLIEQGVIERVASDALRVTDEEQSSLAPRHSSLAETWLVHLDRLDAVHVPATLTGVLQARLDSLPATERETLQRASVVGRLFWDAAVVYVGDDDPASVASVWPALGRRELVYLREETAFEGTHEYVFKHALLRDVTYESVLLRRRRDYHRRAAEWLIAAGGDRVDEYADLIAGHYAAAGDAATEAQWQARAGKHAAARFALPEAERAISRALELLPAAEAMIRYELLLERESIYQLQGRRELQAADLAGLAELAAQLDDAPRSAEVALRYGSFYNFTGDYVAALDAAATAEQLAAAAGDTARQAKAHLQAGQARRARGEYDLARAEFHGALDLARPGAPYVQAEALRALGNTAQEQGDPTAQRETFQQALALAREVGDRRSERRTLNSLGVMEENEGNYEAARAYFEESLALGRAIGDRTGIGTVLGNMGVTAMDTGDLAGARANFEEALDIARETGDTVGVHVWLLNLAFVVATEGDVAAALAYYDEAGRGFEEAGDRSSHGYVLNGIGRVLLETGRAAEALAPLQAAIGLRQELAQPHLLAESRLLLAEALADSGDVPAARVLLEQALPTLDSTGLETNEDTQRGLWAAYRVLAAAGDDRARATLGRLHDEIEATAAHLPADVRQRYREMLPFKREVIRLWQLNT